MDHVVYLDSQAKELEKLLDGSKTMIVRGAAGRKMPYGRVHVGDGLYFVRNDGAGQVLARGTVRSVYNSDPLSPEQSARMVQANQSRLQLTPAQYQRWSVKRYLVLIEVANVEPVAPFAIDRNGYDNLDDWLTVDSISAVRGAG